MNVSHLLPVGMYFHIVSLGEVGGRSGRFVVKQLEAQEDAPATWIAHVTSMGSHHGGFSLL